MCGWIEYQRMTKFVTLRDAYGSTQLVAPDDVSRNSSKGGEIYKIDVVCTGFIWFVIVGLCAVVNMLMNFLVPHRWRNLLTGSEQLSFSEKNYRVELRNDEDCVCD